MKAGEITCRIASAAYESYPEIAENIVSNSHTECFVTSISGEPFKLVLDFQLLPAADYTVCVWIEEMFVKSERFQIRPASRYIGITERDKEERMITIESESFIFLPAVDDNDVVKEGGKVTVQVGMVLGTQNTTPLGMTIPRKERPEKGGPLLAMFAYQYILTGW